MFSMEFFFFLRFYLLIRERHTQREAETQAQGEAGSMQGARRSTRSRVSRVTLWAEGGAKPLSQPGVPRMLSNRYLRGDGGAENLEIVCNPS